MKIILKDLTKIFPGNKEKGIEDTIAVSNLNFTIEDGKLVGLLGPSGCGKSTTLYMIAGLKDLSSGEIYFDNDNVTNLPPEKRGIGLVFQNYALYPHLNVYKNIAFPLTNLKKEAYLRSNDIINLKKINDIIIKEEEIKLLITNSYINNKYNKEAFILGLIKEYKISSFLAKKISNYKLDKVNNYNEKINQIIFDNESKINKIINKLNKKGYSLDNEYYLLNSSNERILKRNKLTKEEIDYLVRDIARLVQIEDQLDRKPSALSGGQQQRVSIARALVKKPRVLLLDEPLSNLDARLRIQTREEIKRIQKETGITTIFVTHDQEEAMSICDTIVVMKDGKVLQIGEPMEVYKNPNNLFVAKFLGTPPINVFKGYVKSNSLFVNNEIVLNNINLIDQELYVAIRPEGFNISKDDTGLSFNIELIMGVGRDLILTCKDHLNNEVKIVLDGDINCKVELTKFNVEPNKIFLFDINNENRIYLDNGK